MMLFQKRQGDERKRWFPGRFFCIPCGCLPVNDQMRLYHEEQFGPIVPIVPFDSIDEPVAYQVNASHGMQVSIFSEDAKEVASLIDPF